MSARRVVTPARLPRRLVGMSVDALMMTAPVLLMLATGALRDDALSPAPGWFYSEWLLKVWLDHPPMIIAPFLWWAIFMLAWQLLWELTYGRTPGAVLARITPVSSSSGDSIGAVHAVFRTIGALLNILTLGLGYALCVIFRDGVALHELLSGTITARRVMDKDEE